MPESFVQTEGVALVDIVLVVSNNQTVPFLGTNVAFVKAELTEVARGISRAIFTVESATSDYVDNLLRDVSGGMTPRLRWRIGFGSPSSQVQWQGYQDYIITKYGASREGLGQQTGYLTKLQAADTLWEISRFMRTIPRKGKISDIVQQIADSYDLATVIEPTSTTGSYIQSYENDYDFIMRRMLPRAVNASGSSNYQFFVRDGTLHFHTIDYQASVKEFSYYDSPGMKLIQLDSVQDHIPLGTSGVRTIVYDPYSGDSATILSDPANTLRLANTSPGVETLSAARLNIPATLGPNRLQDAQAINSSAFEQGSIQNYGLQLTIPKTIFFRANDLVSVVVQPRSSATPPWNGLYQVWRVTSLVDKSTITSTVDFYRGEYATAGASFAPLAQLGESVVQANNVAGGHDPNLAAVATSVLTTGAGNTVSNNQILDTQDPSSAPA